MLNVGEQLVSSYLRYIRGCALMRLMQIEESLAKHVSRITNTHNKPVFHQVTHPAIDIQTDKHPVVGYSEFWQPILEGEFGQLFAGKPVPIRDENWIGKSIRNVKINLFINQRNCYIQLLFTGEDRIERRDQVIQLYPESDYSWEYRDSPKGAKVNFPILKKGRNDRNDWNEIREKLVTMGTDIYNNIDESGL